jgi:hypothetical protein
MARNAALVAAIVVGLALLSGNGLVVLFSGWFAVSMLSIGVVVFLWWLFGPWLRSRLVGEGRQETWGYLGHTLRGTQSEDGRLWISLRDCEMASGLALEARERLVPAREKLKHAERGWMVDETGMKRVLAGTELDPLRCNHLLLFLERNVWRSHRG